MVGVKKSKRRKRRVTGKEGRVRKKVEEEEGDTVAGEEKVKEREREGKKGIREGDGGKSLA